MAALLQMFYEPGKAFEAIRERRIFWPALITLGVLSLLLWIVMVHKIGMENIVRHQIEQSSAQLTPEQMQQRLAVANASWYTNMMYGVGLFRLPLVAVIMSGVLLGVFAMTGKRASFGQMLGTVSYTMVPFTLLTVVAGVVLLMLVTDPETRDPQNLVAFNIGAFLDRASSSKALYALAGSLDLLSICEVLLMSYGTSIVTRTKWSQIVVIIGGLGLLSVIGKVGIAAVRG
jgi:hypothetical protein